MNIKKIKISKKWMVIIIIILIIAGYFIIPQFFKNPIDAYVTEKISTGEILQEVSETGSVEATDNISLGFKTIGKVSKIYVSVGNDVKAGDILASLDLAQLSAQLQSAKAALASANSQYTKLLNGATPEDLKTAEGTVDSAQQDLNNDYDGSINTINNAYTSIYNTHATALSLQNDYFSSADHESVNVQNARVSINRDMINAKSKLESAQNNSSHANIDTAISEIIKDLNNTYNKLKIISDLYYAWVNAGDSRWLNLRMNSFEESKALSALNMIDCYEKIFQKLFNFKISCMEINLFLADWAIRLLENKDAVKKEIVNVERNCKSNQ